MKRRDFLFAVDAIVAQAGRDVVMPGIVEAALPKADHTIRVGPASVELAPGKTIRATGYTGNLPQLP